jgi:hypothetical protein
VAKLFNVPVVMVKKLVANRNRTENMSPSYRYSRRMGHLEPAHGEQMRKVVGGEPDVTLDEIKHHYGWAARYGQSTGNRANIF